MSNDAHIDKIFKDGLGEKNFSNRDAMWQNMEGVLDNDGKKRKRRIAFIILFAGLFTAGFFALRTFNLHTNNIIATKAVSSLKDNSIIAKENTVVSSEQNVSSATTVVPATSAIKAKRPVVINPVNEKVLVSNVNADEDNRTITGEQGIGNDLLTAKIPVDADLVSLQYSKEPSLGIKPFFQKIKADTHPAELKKEPVKAKKISIEAIVGGDILRMNRKAGFYAGIRINRMLDNGTVISVGINYATNTVNDKYRLSSKPAEQWEADAKLNEIHSIRVPLYFQRQLANSKFALMAGLVPTYVIDATVYNVPNSFTGNPDQFRKFTIQDINRFNILFGSGLKYTPFKRIAFELSGSYGFTSLVKNSYVNKSRVNDNFKSIQAGIVFKLK